MATKPQLFLDPKRCKNNIERIAEKAKKLGLTFRPHFKTHQSIEVGRWFRDQGITGITVSSVEMAKYFAQDGWNDITIAFPFYSGMTEGLKELEKKVSLRLFMNSTSDIEHLNHSLRNPFQVYIEIDAGYGRSGVHYTDNEKIESLIGALDKGDQSQFHGFYIHDGGTYQARGVEEIKKRIQASHSALKKLKKRYPSAVTSLGDTPSASVLEELESVDEITPGNLVYYDWMQVQIGSCKPDNVAVWVDVPVAQELSGNKAIIHGGAVHFSKDFIIQDEVKNYGQVLKPNEDHFTPADHCFLSALSQEHGTVSGYKNNLLQDDGSLRILPIHSCLTVNLFDHYRTPSGDIIKKRVLS